MSSSFDEYPGVEDGLNWNNASDGYDSRMNDELAPPMRSKRKVLPQIPQQASAGSRSNSKSLPATPSTSIMTINKSRQLPVPVSTTTYNNSDSYHQPPSTYYNNSDFMAAPVLPSDIDHSGQKTLLSGLFDSNYHHGTTTAAGSQLGTTANVTSPYNSTRSRFFNAIGTSTFATDSMAVVTSAAASSTTKVSQSSTSLLADVKSLFSKTSSSILPTVSSTFSALNGHHNHVGGGTEQPDTESSYGFMKSNKFEEGTDRHYDGTMIGSFGKGALIYCSVN